LTTEQYKRMRDAMPWVDEIAERMAAAKPWMSAGDFKSAGYDEIWRAALVYVEPEPETEGATFKTFAWLGVIGAMLDLAAQYKAQDPARAAVVLLGASDLSHFRDDADPFSEGVGDTRSRVVGRCRSAMINVEIVSGGATWREEGEEGLALHEEHVTATAGLESARVSLDAEEAAVIEMHFWNELPWNKVADALGKSEATVKRRAATARAKLKHELIARGIHNAPAVEGR
jgi:RNA polymerase sigma factor (sigma-70 family)